MAIYNLSEYSPQEYIKIIKSSTIRPKFRVTLLNQDESFREDISDYVILSGSSISVQYQQGQRRSMTLELNNSNGEFNPNGINGKIWLNTKIKVELGIMDFNDNIIYNPCGIFVVGNPTSAREQAQKTISIQCYDKFALLDGTLGGTLDVTYQINAGENIMKVIQETLAQDNGNGYPIDTKPIVFDSLYKSSTTALALSKSPNDSYGAMLIELADMISCDIWYDINGNLTVRSGTMDISHISQPTLWSYADTEFEYISSNTSYDFTKCKNIVTVVGANANNELIYTGTAINNNAQSPTSVGIIGNKVSYIEDSNIYNNALAQQRAEWELTKSTIVQLTISIESTYMIHLDVNECVAISDTHFNYQDDRFIIESLSIPLSIDSRISVSCTNIASLPYYTVN